jgi:histidine ammonia-lyase
VSLICREVFMGVVIKRSPLGIAELLRVVRGESVELGSHARSRIVASQAVVEEALARPDPIYGLNTGVGHGKDRRLSEDELRVQQERLLTIQGPDVCG